MPDFTDDARWANDDLCARIAAHPLLDRLTDAQVASIVAVVTGSPDPAAHLPEPADVWSDRAPGSQWTARVIDVQRAGRPSDWVITYTPLTGTSGQPIDPTSTTAGPWKSSLREFVGSKRCERKDGQMARSIAEAKAARTRHLQARRVRGTPRLSLETDKVGAPMPKPPAGYRACRVSNTDGWTGFQTSHLVKLGPNGGTPGSTVCGLTRFDDCDPIDGSLRRKADLPGWSMGGGIQGPGVAQEKCADCWAGVS